LTGGGMIVSPAPSPNPNHSGLWSVWLTTAGRIGKSGGCIEHGSDVLFGFSQVFKPARVEG